MLRDFVPLVDAVRDYQLDDGGVLGNFQYPTAADWSQWHLNKIVFAKLTNPTAPLILATGRTGTSKTVHLIAAGFHHATTATNWRGSARSRPVFYSRAAELDVAKHLAGWSEARPTETLFLLDDVHDDAEAAARFAQTFVDEKIFEDDNRLILCGWFMPEHLRGPDNKAVVTFEMSPQLVEATAASAGVALTSDECQKLSTKPFGTRLILYGARCKPDALRAADLAHAWGAFEASFLEPPIVDLLDSLSLLRLSGLAYAPNFADSATVFFEELKRRCLARTSIAGTPEVSVWSTSADEIASTWILYRIGPRNTLQFDNFLQLCRSVWSRLASGGSESAPLLLNRWRKPLHASHVLSTLHLDSPDAASPILGPLCLTPSFQQEFSHWSRTPTAALELRLQSLALLPLRTPWLDQLAVDILNAAAGQIERAITIANPAIFFGVAGIRIASVRAERAQTLCRFIDSPTFFATVTNNDSASRDRFVSVIKEVFPSRLSTILDRLEDLRLAELTQCEPYRIWARLKGFVREERRHGIRLAMRLPKALLKRAVISDPRVAFPFVRDTIFDRSTGRWRLRPDARTFWNRLAEALATVDYGENEFRHWKHAYYLVNWVNLSARIAPARSLDSPRFRSLLENAVFTANGAVLHYLTGFAKRWRSIFPSKFLAEALEQSLKQRQPPLGERIHCLWNLEPQRAFKVVPDLLREHPEPPDIKQAFWLVWNSWLATPDEHKKPVLDYAEGIRASLQDLPQTSTGSEAMLQWLALAGLLAWILKEPAPDVDLTRVDCELLHIDSATATAFEVFGIAAADHITQGHVSMLGLIANALAQPSEKFRDRIRRMNQQQKMTVRQIYRDGLQRLSSRSEFRDVAPNFAAAITGRVEPLLATRS